MKKRLFTMLLATTMVATLFGCTTTPQEEATPADTNTTEDTSEEEPVADIPTTPDLDGATLTLWMPPLGGGNVEIDDKAFWEGLLADRVAEMNGALTVEMVPWESYEEKYLTGISGGTGPDVGYMYNEMIKSYIDLGALEPLDAYYTAEELERYYYLDYGNIEGKQYTMPLIVGGARVLYCNMDILNAAGITEAPTTWAEFEEAGMAILENTDKIPLQQGWGGHFGDMNTDFYPYLWQAGGDLYNDAGELVLNSPEAVEAATWLYSLKEKGIIPESTTATDNSAKIDSFAAGDVGMIVSSSAEASRRLDDSFVWDFVPYLSKEEGEQGYTMAVSDALVLLSASENKEAAVELIKTITSVEGMDAFHTDLYPSPPVGEGEQYLDNPVFEEFYTSDQVEGLRTLPVVSGAVNVYTTLFSNMQLMMLGELTPEQALADTETYAASLTS